MHEAVFDKLYEIWISTGRPKYGHVFLNSKGTPYSDTRSGKKYQGGSPIRSVNKTAVKNANKKLSAGNLPIIEKFTPHDWRHNFATSCIEAGVDVFTLKELGGWKDIKSLQKYVKISMSSQREALKRLK